jgi:hypothetical protein
MTMTGIAFSSGMTAQTIVNGLIFVRVKVFRLSDWFLSASRESAWLVFQKTHWVKFPVTGTEEIG